MTPEARLKQLGLQLPTPMAPAGSYVAARIDGKSLYLAGQGPQGLDGKFVTGKVGSDVTLDQATAAARLTGLNLLAVMRAELGSLDRVAGILKVFGMVNCAPGFNNTPAVINGCSDLMVEIFGEPGKHARSAVGMAELPFDICVEIELEAVLA